MKYTIALDKTTLLYYLTWQFGTKRGYELFKTCTKKKIQFALYKLPNFNFFNYYTLEEARRELITITAVSSYKRAKLKKAGITVPLYDIIRL